MYPRKYVRGLRCPYYLSSPVSMIEEKVHVNLSLFCRRDCLGSESDFLKVTYQVSAGFKLWPGSSYSTFPHLPGLVFFLFCSFTSEESSMLSGATVVSLRFWVMASVFHDPHLIQILRESSFEGISISGSAGARRGWSGPKACPRATFQKAVP